MATTGGAPLASSKLVVTQSDLHLVVLPSTNWCYVLIKPPLTSSSPPPKSKQTKPRSIAARLVQPAPNTSSLHPLPMGVSPPIEEGPRRSQTTDPSLPRCGPAFATP